MGGCRGPSPISPFRRLCHRRHVGRRRFGRCGPAVARCRLFGAGLVHVQLGRRRRLLHGGRGFPGRAARMRNIGDRTASGEFRGRNTANAYSAHFCANMPPAARRIRTCFAIEKSSLAFALQYMQRLGADWIATGHYAQVRHSGAHPQLLKAVDAAKDQSYFLHGVAASALSKTLFPLGGLRKAQVRSWRMRPACRYSTSRIAPASVSSASARSRSS